MLDSIIFSLLAIAILFFIGRLFYKDNKIEKEGIITTAEIIENRYISSNQTGGSKIFFILSYIDEKTNETKIIERTEIVPNFYSSQLQKGMRVKIKYLKENPSEMAFILE
ncbi:hypothetical protein Z042_15555 [Chania multitudinisentens RB-25]|uniref:DUF3592 domain-containing protein n=1 Tax=Chania multitudinisentens RB-25 TaxID=1441930 RepID=W0LGI1_9GAMM|nr:hypothetical protein [Chania multitudinisentens]AHG22851.1 hypothetical protein Z042_15555 [Chania multitudinisentens RB-25]